MCVCLESLELSAEQLESARDQIREQAYLLWHKAGRPECDGVEYWTAAEKEWISHNYVPHRPFELETEASIDAQTPVAV